jgi:transcription elongation factor Elf1
MVKFYCGMCNNHQIVEIEPLKKDDLNGGLIWGNIICKRCHLVIACISTDAEGIYQFVRGNG